MQPGSPKRLWWGLLILAVLLLNALWHVRASIAMESYSPGLASAVTANLPFGVYVFRRAVHERWVSSRAFFWLIPCAFVVHGPILFGLLTLTVISPTG